MKHSAPVTRAIILGNVGVAVVDVLLRINHGADDTWFRTVFSLSPANLLDGAWWEPFTYMWLHDEGDEQRGARPSEVQRRQVGQGGSGASL